MSDLEEVGVLHVGGRLDNVCDTLLDLAFLAVVRALVGVLGVTRSGLAGNVELSVAGSHVGVRDRRLGHDADTVHTVGGALVFAGGASVGLLAGNVKHPVGGSHVGVWHSTDSVVDDVWDRGWLHGVPVAVREARLLASQVKFAVNVDEGLFLQLDTSGGAREACRCLVEVRGLLGFANTERVDVVFVSWEDNLLASFADLRKKKKKSGEKKDKKRGERSGSRRG